MLKRTKQGMKDLAFPEHDLISGFNCQFVFCPKIPFIKKDTVFPHIVAAATIVKP